LRAASKQSNFIASVGLLQAPHIPMIPSTPCEAADSRAPQGRAWPAASSNTSVQRSDAIAVADPDSNVDRECSLDSPEVQALLSGLRNKSLQHNLVFRRPSKRRRTSISGLNLKAGQLLPGHSNDNQTTEPCLISGSSECRPPPVSQVVRSSVNSQDQHHQNELSNKGMEYINFISFSITDTITGSWSQNGAQQSYAYDENMSFDFCSNLQSHNRTEATISSNQPLSLSFPAFPDEIEIDSLGNHQSTDHSIYLGSYQSDQFAISHEQQQDEVSNRISDRIAAYQSSDSPTTGSPVEARSGNTPELQQLELESKDDILVRMHCPLCLLKNEGRKNGYLPIKRRQLRRHFIDYHELEDYHQRRYGCGICGELLELWDKGKEKARDNIKEDFLKHVLEHLLKSNGSSKEWKLELQIKALLRQEILYPDWKASQRKQEGEPYWEYTKHTKELVNDLEKVHFLRHKELTSDSTSHSDLAALKSKWDRNVESLVQQASDLVSSRRLPNRLVSQKENKRVGDHSDQRSVSHINPTDREASKYRNGTKESNKISFHGRNGLGLVGGQSIGPGIAVDSESNQLHRMDTDQSLSYLTRPVGVVEQSQEDQLFFVNPRDIQLSQTVVPPTGWADKPLIIGDEESADEIRRKRKLSTDKLLDEDYQPAAQDV
jgi:hypothetical protein